MPTKSEYKIQGNKKSLKKGLHIPMVMDGGEGKRLKKCCVVENIENQQKLRENDEIRYNEGDRSPMCSVQSPEQKGMPKL